MNVAARVASRLGESLSSGPSRLARRLGQGLNWSRTYRTVSYARSALWLVPLLAIALVLVLGPLLRALDAWGNWDITGLDVEGARALFQTIITLTLSFLVFIFGSLLVAIQVAGGQLTPRIIATTLLRDNVVRYTVGLFVFTLVLAVMSLNRLQGHVYQLVVFITGLAGVACLTNFLFFIDYTARLLRPVSILTRVGENGLEVIYTVYPALLDAAGDEATPVEIGAPRREVTHDGASEVVLAVDVATLVSEARSSGGVIEFAPRVGDFLAWGQVLFRLYGGAAAVPDRRLRAAVAFGPERTLEQDPMFAFRILVDIALKALSPAINDPTTAVLALDQVHRLLREVGRRRLRGNGTCDADDNLRLILRTPDWDDFVNMACSEIRACGASCVQVARRMAAMLDEIAHVLPTARHAAIRHERQLLERAIDDAYRFPEDRALARVADMQGLGGGANPAGGT